MKQKLIFPLIIVLLSVAAGWAQTVADDGKKESVKNEISPELRKEAAEFLRNTAVEVNNMRTLENRISFSAEMAGLMWFHDEREARAMYQNVINNFRQLLGQYDGELNALGVGLNDLNRPPSSGSSATTALRKFAKALSVREQITMSLAEHDPRLALDFFNETGEAVSNPMMRKQIEDKDDYFQTRLLAEIAENDVDTALKYGRKAIAKGLNYETLNLLRKIYNKDADKGIAFGQDIISQVKSDPPAREKLYLLSSLLNLNNEIKAARDSDKADDKKKPPIFSDQSLREIADVLARSILEIEDAEALEMEGYLPDIEKYAPARAVQIRSKFGLKKTKTGKMMTVEADEALDLMAPPVPPDLAEADDTDQQLMKGIESLNAKELPEEQRRAVIGESRRIIDSLDDRQKRITALSALAVQITRLGDKKLASEVLDDARSLINIQPVNYRDYMETWALVGGYAAVDPDKAFPILEGTIYRLNDTISAFVKVGEFIDVEGDMVEEGEVQLGSFGGGFTRGMLEGLGTADTTVRSLAVADFRRTRDLTNRFDRQEVRILAKMLVLRAILK